jgi:hypothetical protein
MFSVDLDIHFQLRSDIKLQIYGDFIALAFLQWILTLHVNQVFQN